LEVFGKYSPQGVMWFFRGTALKEAGGNLAGIRCSFLGAR